MTEKYRCEYNTPLHSFIRLAMFYLCLTELSKICLTFVYPYSTCIETGTQKDPICIALGQAGRKVASYLLTSPRKEGEEEDNNPSASLPSEFLALPTPPLFCFSLPNLNPKQPANFPNKDDFDSDSDPDPGEDVRTSPSANMPQLVTKHKTPSENPIVRHPNRHSTNPPQSEPRNMPRNWAIVWMPKAWAMPWPWFWVWSW